MRYLAMRLCLRVAESGRRQQSRLASRVAGPGQKKKSCRRSSADSQYPQSRVVHEFVVFCVVSFI